jgi:hypothetical protein
MKPQFRIRTLLLAIALVAVLLSLSSTLAPVAAWSGRYELIIHVHSLSPEEIVGVSYAAYFRRDHADWLAKEAEAKYDSEFRPASPDGTGYIARIPCSGRRSLLGSELSYTEARFVVLQIACTDREIREIVEVPEGRGKRTVSISIDDPTIP